MILSFSYSENLKFWMRTKTWNGAVSVAFAYDFLPALPLAYPVAETAVFRCRFTTVAFLTERLPVRRIPKQRRVSVVRDNVIHARRHADNAFSLAFRTKWVLLQKTLCHTPPSTGVPTFRGRS